MEVGFYPISLCYQPKPLKREALASASRRQKGGNRRFRGAKLFVLNRKNYFEVLCNSLQIIEKSEGVLFDSHRPLQFH